MKTTFFLLLGVPLFGCASPTDVCANGACGDGGPEEAAPSEPPLLTDSATDAPCVGLECQIASCSSADGTTITGKVYDPAGVNPLYNVFVYVPNAPLDEIVDGVACTQCQAPATGSPIASATTKTDGSFTISNAPSGDSIPLVMQLGKWRRVITIPHVTSCANNPQTDKNSTRLPRKHKEGSPLDHIPRIAFTTGCDAGECFLLKRIGIDDSEFTGPKGNGRVHMYQERVIQGYTVPNGWGSLPAFYDDLAAMKKYDIIFQSCECYTLDRKNGYTNVEKYLASGGRYFGTHYYYNMFANQSQCGGDATCKGVKDFNAVADWGGDITFSSGSIPIKIDTSHPKGAALGEWLTALGKAKDGTIDLIDTRGNAHSVAPKTTRWLYDDKSAEKLPYYFSFNVPVAAAADKQCGRSVFSGVHLSGNTDASWMNNSFPKVCSGYPKAEYAGNESALEFLFFDLSSCVQDDSKPPVPVPPK